MVCSYFGLLFEEFRLHQKRYIDKKTWEDREGNTKKHVGRPGFVRAWNITKTIFDFNSEFGVYIERKIDEARGDVN